MVECDLAKVDVAGSNPVSRSNVFSPLNPPHFKPAGRLKAGESIPTRKFRLLGTGHRGRSPARRVERLS